MEGGARARLEFAFYYSSVVISGTGALYSICCVLIIADNCKLSLRSLSKQHLPKT